MCAFSELYPGCARPRWPRMGSICHSSAGSTAQSARGNDDANIDFSSQHDISATWKLSEKMYPGVDSTYTTYYQMKHIWDLRGVLVEDWGFVLKCLLKQLAIVTLHRTWKQRSSRFQRRTSINPMMDIPLLTRRDATPCFLVGMYSWWLTQACHLCYS